MVFPYKIRLRADWIAFILTLSARLPPMNDRHHRSSPENRPGMSALRKRGEAYEREVAAFPAWPDRRDERRLHPGYRVGVECGRTDGPCRHDDRHLSGPEELPGTTGRSDQRSQRL